MSDGNILGMFVNSFKFRYLLWRIVVFLHSLTGLENLLHPFNQSYWPWRSLCFWHLIENIITYQAIPHSYPLFRQSDFLLVCFPYIIVSSFIHKVYLALYVETETINLNCLLLIPAKNFVLNRKIPWYFSSIFFRTKWEVNPRFVVFTVFIDVFLTLLEFSFTSSLLLTAGLYLSVIVDEATFNQSCKIESS